MLSAGIAIKELIDPKTSRLGEVDIVSDQERKFLLDMSRPVTEPFDGRLHQLIEEQAH